MNKQPKILYEGINSLKDLIELRDNNKIWCEKDFFLSQLEELFEVEYPSAKFNNSYVNDLNNFVKVRTKSNENYLIGNWIYLPWNGFLIHTINEKEYFKLRTNRNQYIIRSNEQEILKNFCIAICGLSIGGNMALNLTYNGIANSMKLFDFDKISTTNLNRLNVSIKDINEPKIDIICQRIYEINPYSSLYKYESGINENILIDMFRQEPKPKLIIEELDDFLMKIKIRIEAKKNKIPVIMVTNLGDSILMDIERYDKDTSLEIFNGLLNKTAEEILSKEISETDKIKYAIQIVGIDNLSESILESMWDINKKLVGRPQINSSVSIGSGIASYLARKIALNENLPSGRKIFNLTDILKLESTENLKNKEIFYNSIKKVL